MDEVKIIRFEDGSAIVSNGEPDFSIDLKDVADIKWGYWMSDYPLTNYANYINLNVTL